MDYYAELINPSPDHFSGDASVRRHDRLETDRIPRHRIEVIGGGVLDHLDVHIIAQAAVPSEVNLDVARRYRDRIHEEQ